MFAQNTKSSSVVVLKFSASGVAQEVMDLFYLELHEHIRAHERMHVAAGGEVTINDLMLMAGCESPSPECLVGLSDFVEGDRIVFGSVQKQGDVHSFDAQMFDFAEGGFVREIVDFKLRGDSRQIQYEIPAVVEALLYGDAGKLRVNITGSGTPRIFVNGMEKGRAPLVIEDLPLGEVVVVARGDDGSEQTETVALRRIQTAEVGFAFEDAVAAPPAVNKANAYLIPAVIVTGVGVAGMVVGVLGHTQLSSLEEEASLFVNGRSAIDGTEVTRADDLQSSMNSAHTMRIVGYSIGAAGLVAGGVLLVKAFSSGDSGDRAPQANATPVDASKSRISWQVLPGRDSFALGMGLSF
ncbi:MAG: hypothetical protein H0U74_12000 [Bradymonadaceae bacterium]|nr:hypothetical protein [Lujinxingiaceae bacterium]